MSARRHTYGVTIKGTFTDFTGRTCEVFTLMYADDGASPAAFGSKQDALDYAARFNRAWPCLRWPGDEPNYKVIQLR